MMKVIGQITEADVKEFDESYSLISSWARRHDKARGLNYVVPELGELEAALKVVNDWFERVRKYKV